MKQKLLLKSLVLLFALIVGSMNAWADDPTITLTQAALELTGSYSSNATKTIGGVTFKHTDLMKNNTDIQAKATSGVIFNTTAFPTNIKSVAITHTGTARSTTIFGSANGTDWTQIATGSGSITGDFTGGSYKYFKITRGSNAAYWSQIVITYTTATEPGTTDAPTITGYTPFFGTTTATITNAASADGANIFYTLNGDAPTTTTSATCFAYSDPFSLDATTTVKAIAKKSTDTYASSVTSKTFTKVTPITVADALTAIAALADNGTIAEQSVRGIVTAVSSISSNKITYTISDDVAGSNSLTVFKGKGLHNADFAAVTDVKVGDDVVIYGTLKKYKSGSTITPEFIEGNYLLYQVHKTAPTFTLSSTAETLSMGNTETVDVTLTTNTDGEITCESSNNNAATVALKSAGVYTITAVAEGTATITIKSALTDNYQPAEATVDITVNDTREAPGLAFANASVTKTWGESFTGQALTNPHSLPVTWSSTEESVATVNSTGVVTVLKAGTTTIKATFDGDATYKKAIVSYTLTVNKAPAGLSYTTTEFDIMLNDDSFVAPTLNNPNGLTVTYASNNGTVAVVDENTGALVYNETAAGTAKITASFAGDDRYYPGSADYTINIVDPSVKGTKYNPYTVAEVIDGTATGSNVYVLGYIVGEYPTSGTTITTSSFTTDANIALADAFSTSTPKASAIPVQLNTTALKNAWGNKTNKGATMGYQILVKGTIDTYFSVNGIKPASEVTAKKAPVAISEYEWATFVSKFALDFDGSAVKAYIVTGHSGNALVKTQMEGTVPANTPLLLNAAEGNFYIPIAASSTTDVSGNLLKAGDGNDVSWNPATSTAYVLSGEDGTAQFKKLTSAVAVPEGKAYLLIPEPIEARDFDLDDGTTVINALENATKIDNNAIYDLSGRRVENPTKGIYIINGKKVIFK